MIGRSVTLSCCAVKSDHEDWSWSLGKQNLKKRKIGGKEISKLMVGNGLSQQHPFHPLHPMVFRKPRDDMQLLPGVCCSGCFVLDI
jgi:hypothetical protein